MRVRITQKLSPSHGLVQESEGVIVHIVHDLEEAVFLQEPLVAPERAGETVTVCEKVPLGVWLRMDEMENHPLLEEYKESTKRYIETNNIALDMLDSEKDLANLIFLERTTSYPFKLVVEGTSYTITRTQLPFTHAMVRTAQASQGTYMYVCMYVLVGKEKEREREREREKERKRMRERERQKQERGNRWPNLSFSMDKDRERKRDREKERERERERESDQQKRGNR
jgi:hypothetical protein